MYVYEKYDYSMFYSRFKDYGRIDQFPKGLYELFTYLESLAENTELPLEIDVIGLCCEFAEIHTDDVKNETGCEDIEKLEQMTTVLKIDDDTIIYEVV